MRLSIDDTFATALFTTPIVADWIAPPPELTVEIVPSLTDEQIGATDAALAPAAALPKRHQTHAVLRDAAVIADAVGAIAMRTPVRPDEIERPTVRLLDASGIAATLARATLRPFYGIEPAAWVCDPDAPEAASAQVVVVEGAEALRDPEAGFSEDLVRAWFILTAQPVVTHLLLAPRGLPSLQIAAIATFFAAVREAGLERRRDWLPALADREGIPRERSSAFWAAQRLALERSDEVALLELLRRGSPDASGANLAGVEFVSGATGG